MGQVQVDQSDDQVSWRFLVFGLGVAALLLLVVEYLNQRSSGEGVNEFLAELPGCLAEAQRGLRCEIEIPDTSEIKYLISAFGVVTPTVVSAIVALLIYKFQSRSGRETSAILEEQRALQAEQRSLLRGQSRMIALQRLEMLYKEAAKIEYASEIRRFEQALSTILNQPEFENDAMILAMVEGVISEIRKNPVCPLPSVVGMSEGRQEGAPCLQEYIGELAVYDQVDCEDRMPADLERKALKTSSAERSCGQECVKNRLSSNAVRDYWHRYRSRELSRADLATGPLSDYLKVLYTQALALRGYDEHLDFVDAVNELAVATLISGLRHSDFEVLNELAASVESKSPPQKFQKKYAVIDETLYYLHKLDGGSKVSMTNGQPSFQIVSIEPCLGNYDDSDVRKLRSLLIATAGYCDYPNSITGGPLNRIQEEEMLRQEMGQFFHRDAGELLEQIIELKRERNEND